MATVSPVPTEADAEESSLKEDTLRAPLIVGEDSRQLSDLSDENDYFSTLSGSKHRFERTFSSWYRRIAPLMRSKKVRMLTIANMILTIISLLLFLTILVLFTAVIIFKHRVSKETPKDMPCLFEWTEWNQCSATCRLSDSSALPQMSRRISRIFKASGKYSACPDGLTDKFVQFAPCNTQLCSNPLSSYGWSDCFYRVPHKGKEKGCYQIRNLPVTDALVKIDTTLLYRPCEDNDCPEFMA